MKRIYDKVISSNILLLVVLSFSAIAVTSQLSAAANGTWWIVALLWIIAVLSFALMVQILKILLTGITYLVHRTSLARQISSAKNDDGLWENRITSKVDNAPVQKELPVDRFLSIRQMDVAKDEHIVRVIHSYELNSLESPNSRVNLVNDELVIPIRIGTHTHGVHLIDQPRIHNLSYPGDKDRPGYLGKSVMVYLFSNQAGTIELDAQQDEPVDDRVLFSHTVLATNVGVLEDTRTIKVKAGSPHSLTGSATETQKVLVH